MLLSFSVPEIVYGLLSKQQSSVFYGLCFKNLLLYKAAHLVMYLNSPVENSKVLSLLGDTGESLCICLGSTPVGGESS